jgi:hypothetical protein
VKAEDVKNLLSGRTLSAFFENVKRIADALSEIAKEVRWLRIHLEGGDNDVET